MSFLHVKLIGEDYDKPCNPTEINTVIKDNHDVWFLADNDNFRDWVKGIVFPNEELAKYFIAHQLDIKYDLKDAMDKSGNEYVVHLLTFRYPKPDELYADQITVK